MFDPVPAGSTVNVDLTIYSRLTGLVVNVTGADITAVLRKKLTDAENIIEKTVGDGVTILSGSAGEIRVRFESADTVSLLGTYLLDTKIVDESDDTLYARHKDGSFPSLVFTPSLI